MRNRAYPRGFKLPLGSRQTDFVHDQLVTGRKIRVLTVVDTFSRSSPTVDRHFSYRAQDVVATLEKICAKLGYPKPIRVHAPKSGRAGIRRSTQADRPPV